jgi:flagellar hook-length control protein FliK
MNTILALSLNVAQLSGMKSSSASPPGKAGANEDDSTDDSATATETSPFKSVLSKALSASAQIQAAPEKNAPGQSAATDDPSSSAPLIAETDTQNEGKKDEDLADAAADLSSVAASSLLANDRQLETTGARTNPTGTSVTALAEARSSSSVTDPTPSVAVKTSVVLPSTNRQQAPPVGNLVATAPLSDSSTSLKTVTAPSNATSTPNTPILPGIPGGDTSPENRSGRAEGSGASAPNGTASAPNQTGTIPLENTMFDQGSDPLPGLPKPSQTAEMPSVHPVPQVLTTEAKQQSLNASARIGTGSKEIPGPPANTSSPSQVGATTTGVTPPANVHEQVSPGGATGTVGSTPTVAAQIADAIMGKPVLIQRGGTTDIYLRLNPPELGTVNLHLRAMGQTLTARVVVSGDAAQSAIETQLPQLRARLGEVGITLGGFDVAQQGQQSQQSRPQQEDSSSDNVGSAILPRAGSFNEAERSQPQSLGQLDVLV